MPVGQKINNYDSDIHFRLASSARRHLQIRANMSGISESDYLRRLIDADMGKEFRMQSKEELLAHTQLVNEINHIGLNINQIVKSNNSGFYSAADKRDLISALNSIYELLEEH